MCSDLLVRDGQGPAVYFLLEIHWRLPVHSASYRKSSSKNFLHSSFQLLRHRLESKYSCNIDNGIKSNVSAVFDVLHFFPVSWRFFQLFHYQCWCSRNDCGGGLHRKYEAEDVIASFYQVQVLQDSFTGRLAYHAIDNTQSDCDFNPLPVHRGFLDVLTDLFRRLRGNLRGCCKDWSHRCCRCVT